MLEYRVNQKKHEQGLSIVMKHWETGAHGSFTAWGSGFLYNYKAETNTLKVHHCDRQRALASLKFDYRLARQPLAYVVSLDKTNQIHALMFSNNATLNLTETMDLTRIKVMVDATARLSRYAYDLSCGDLYRFTTAFAADFNLHHVEIRHFAPNTASGNAAFYAATIQTQHHNAITVRGHNLVRLTGQMAERTLHDLITMETGHFYSNSAQNLLNMASKLALISQILDEDFVPARLLIAPENPQKSGIFEEKTDNDAMF